MTTSIDVRLNLDTLYKLKAVYPTPFSTVHEALRKYQLNPARAKFINFFEPETKSKPYYPDFHNNHPDRLWARVTKCLHAVLSQYKPEQRLAWWMCNIGDRTKLYHPDDIPFIFKVSRATAFRWLGNINDDIEDEFMRRKLIPRVDTERAN